ncbi:hypothetical protein [Clostridium tagluense]|uniref:hypothetical protein n=1 Tax=Clostridium tagluense TaxID=360422 RepID=UPI001CF4317B|nr:hypothetical protein [Clostridium tagluense]MCB2297303.1 hypothetical protein [Clostridium tagluense]
MPNFNPIYKGNTCYSYKNDNEKKNLKNVLTETSKGYCMYCYTKILVDGKNFGQLEHSIEKINSEELINCISNIAIACPKCNLSFKKKGQEKRNLSNEEIRIFEEDLECTNSCIEKCSKYDELRIIYSKKKSAQIILQPFGFKNNNTGNDYLIQYDLLNQRFIPSNKYPYTKQEKVFIVEHIKRFNLNDFKYRTKEISNFCEDVIEYRNIPKIQRYFNFIVDLFIEKLHGMSKEESIKICELIYTQILMKNKN